MVFYADYSIALIEMAWLKKINHFPAYSPYQLPVVNVLQRKRIDPILEDFYENKTI